jgi:hypothetical protein
MMKWIATVDGAANVAYVARIVRDAEGVVLHMADGNTVKSSAMFEIVDGELRQIELDDDAVPF